MAVLTINRGLVTSPNELSKPDGAAEILDNCVIDFDNIIQSRRGFGEFGNKTDDDSVAKQLMTYKGRIIRHFSDKLSFDSTGNGDFLNFSGSYEELIERLRIKYFELTSNLYFTTKEGIKKISAKAASDFTADAGFITNAGAVKAVGVEGIAVPSASGFLPAQSKVGYKILWAKKDVNGNIIRGVPSSRFVITNTSKDINVGEEFKIVVTTTGASVGGINNTHFFTFDTPTNKFACWFNISGSDVAPTDTALVGRELKEVQIYKIATKNKENYMAKIAETLNTVSDITVTATATEVTVTNRDGGNVLDASEGNIPTTFLDISKVFDGQTSTGTPANATLTFTVPTEIINTDDRSYFYEVYRTAYITVSSGQTLNDIDPGEEFQKIAESPVVENSSPIPATINYEDVVPEAFRQGGLFLYTNPVTGEGALYSNEAPPIAHDVAVFKGSAFYANTKERHRLQFNLLSVNQFTSGTSKIYIGNSQGVRAYTFVGRNEIVNFTAKKPSETVDGSYFDILSAQNKVKYRVWFSKGVAAAPSQDSCILLKVNLQLAVSNPTLDTIQFSVDAFIDAFFDILDFEVTDLGSGVIRLTYQDNGQADPVVESSPATGWITPSVFQQGLGEDATNNEVLLSGLASQGLSVEDTARSLERIINKDILSPVNAFYASSSNDLPGILILESKSLSDDAFYLGFSHATTTPVFEPSLPIARLVDDIVAPGVITTTTNHELIAGQQIYTFIKPTSFPPVLSGKKIVATTPALNTLTISGFSISGSPITSFDQAIIFTADVVSDNSVNPNRVYFSKIGQPEAVPLVNYIDIGPRDKAIQRIMALRDSLVVLKEDGVYIISGSAAPNFSVRLSDSSALTFAPDTATNLNNLIYVLTSQGVVTVSETGVGVISRNIENKIQEVANAKFNYKLMSWGMSSESDRSYILWLPEKTTDMYPTQAFRYNTFTRTWTRWTKPANCGVVNPIDDKIYIGDASGRPYVLKERKNFERQDYADREIVRGLGANAINGTTFTISSVTELAAGDVLTQKQYLDINKFNRFLKKLDRDTIASSDYISLKAQAGDNLAEKLLEVANKLQTDGIMVPTPSNSNDYIALRDDFNSIIAYLNSPGSNTGFKNYKQAVDLLTYETLVTSVNQRTNLITVKYVNKFIQGDVSFFKGISCLVQYAPQHFGKPEATKQVPDGTLIFDQNNFWGGTVAYSSDRSYDFAPIVFSGKGPGFWDGYNWANVTFGGEGNEVPVRTLVPRDKSRCRYIHVQFTHINAREEWKLIGVSLEPREVSTRGYR